MPRRHRERVTTAKSGPQENRDFELDCKFLSRLPAASVALLSPNFLARRGAAECTYKRTGARKRKFSVNFNGIFRYLNLNFI